MPRYRHTAKITFKGQFPIDMLRYDQASPLTETDSSRIQYHEFDHTKPTEVVVCRVTESKAVPWTVDRWKSFGAKVEHQTTQKQP